MKLRFAILIAQAFGAISRLARKGRGVMVTGRIILKISPHAVRELSKGRRVVLISGTNGKTTTTSLIYQALSLKDKVVSNYTGANLFAGVAAALAENRKAPIAVLEVDEMVLPWAIKESRPEMLVLLNLGRDQLDRLSEVRMVAKRWKDALADLPPHCKILADADDPFVTWAALEWPHTIWMSAGTLGHLDASTCPSCGAVLQWFADSKRYWCQCGFAKPNANWILEGDVLAGPNGKSLKVVSGIPGRAAQSNAAKALVVADAFGIAVEKANEQIAKVVSVDGRFGKLRIGNTNFRLMLSKNPSSWRETLATSQSGPPRVLLTVNANTQDGKDTSWLWDVDFKPLANRYVVVTGERRLDVSARLTVDGIAHHVVADEIAAAHLLGEVDADLIASYTAFHRLAKSAAK